MKLIVAIIKPARLDEVRQALAAIGVEGMTVSEVKGHGRQRGQTEIYRGAEYSTTMVPKVKLEIACAADRCAALIEAIAAAAHTGAIGDGKLFIIDLCEAMRIRTGERDEAAL